MKSHGGILAAAAALMTALFYGRAWRFDLQCDDLLMIRPWSRAELSSVWHGTWDPWHGFAVFFRPIAAWFYAGTFELFGLNAPAHMLLSLALLAGVMWLLSLVVARESRSTGTGVLAAMIYAIHPNTPWSTGTWVTNDFHKLGALAALGALLVWQRVRHEPQSRWLLIAPLAVIAFLVKEDGLMLIPALITLQWARARFIGDVNPPAPALIAAAGAIGGALGLWRWLALGELGGFPLPRSLYAVVHNITRGPIYAFTMHGRLSVLTAGEKAAFVVCAGIIAWVIVTMPRDKRFLPLMGLTVMFWYALPLALISNVMRYYMITIASVMVTAPVVAAIAGAMRGAGSRMPHRSGAAIIVMLLATRGLEQQQELTNFAPCQRLEHECVAWVLESVPTLPPEARAYVAGTETACAAGVRPRIGDSDALTFGLGATSIETMSGARSNEVNGTVIALVRRSATGVTLSIRHSEASADRPVRLEITADGARSTRELTTAAWTTIDVPLTNGLRSWLRGAHRVDATFSRPGGEWRAPK